MAEYVYIQNYTRNGVMGISHHVFDQIAEIATNQVKGAETFTRKSSFFVHRPAACEIKNGLVTVKIFVVISADANINEVCLNIQENVANSLAMMTEVIPFKIGVEVVNVNKKLS
jgi:uncharacterized alkaline shock family protein YloU